jgi:RNA 2',3'-cyclic 3'-phosphodiesterase
MLRDSGPNPARVFFAFWPDAETAVHLHQIALQWQKKLGGRVTRADSIHATLVFVGNVSADQLPALLALPSSIQLPAFQVSFDTADCWQHNHIAHLGMHNLPEPLRQLQFELETGVRGLDLKIETRAYRPHLTLIRKAECNLANTNTNTNANTNANKNLAAKENPAIKPVTWSVRDFVLVKSSMSANGSRYEQIGRWPLL